MQNGAEALFFQILFRMEERNGRLMNYSYTPIKLEIVLDYIVTIHYFEYTRGFEFPGEAHDFWELLYVDKGEVEIFTGDRRCTLTKGDIIFHKPMEFHGLRCLGGNAPNLLVAAFVTGSPAMSFFQGRLLRAGDPERDLLARVIREARSAYSSALNDPYLEKLILREDVPFGAEQLIKISLEQLLIQLIRRDSAPVKVRATSSIRETADSALFRRVTAYLEAHIREQLTLDDVCRENIIGRSSLQKTFRSRTGGGVMEYFSRMKIETAKQYIRDGQRNFTEIAHDLGFSTIHYFSRRFKVVTGMTPTEYASSVKILEER